MKNLIKKNVFRIMVAAFALLICLVPVSAASDCPVSGAKVYTKVIYNQCVNTDNKNIEAALAEVMAKVETAAKSYNAATPSLPNTIVTNPVETPSVPVKPTTPTETPTAPTTPTAPSSIQDIERQVVELVNQVRIQNGLSALTINEELSNVARVKANDMANNHYFNHNSPTYGSPFDMMKQFGISYRTAGENIAMGQTTAQQVFDGWMNSEGHRANILNSSFTEIGVGYTSNGNYWSQMFIG